MRDTLPGISPADIHDPFAKHRRVQQRVQPYCLSHRRSGAHHLQQQLLGHDSDQATRERLHIVIGDLEQAVLNVEEFARNVERNDLPRSIAQDLLAVRKALQQYRADFRLLPFAREICITLKLLPSPGEVDYGCLVFARDGEPALPPSARASRALLSRRTRAGSANARDRRAPGSTHP